jgi:hypothetical protein
MINEIQNLFNKYLVWLKDKTVLRQIDEWVEITTPYLDRHNDYLQIYVKRDNDGFVLTDDGYIISDLQLSGCSLESGTRKNLLKQTLNGFGISMEERTLFVHATADNFALKKHNLVQAMLAVNDLFYTATSMVKNLFFEDVQSWLNMHDIRYISKVKFTGKSGFDYMFDFVIPASQKYPERILGTVNNPDRQHIQSLAFSWIDTKDNRPDNSVAYAFLNDYDHPLKSNVKDALINYGIRPILWKKREEAVEELAA